MKRPGYNLTWYSIRHQWSSISDRSNSISNHIDTHYPKCRTATMSDNITISNKQSLQFSINRERQRSDSVPKISVSPASKLQNADDNHHLSAVSHSCETNTIYLELRTIISQLAMITDHIRRQEKHENESQDWKFVAMVIDRLCLILFLIFLAIFTSLIFLSASNFYIL